MPTALKMCALGMLQLYGSRIDVFPNSGHPCLLDLYFTSGPDDILGETSSGNPLLHPGCVEEGIVINNLYFIPKQA